MRQHARSEPRILRLYVGLFVLVALAMLLVASWLRFLVPTRHHQARLRDVSWVTQPGR